MVFFQVYMMQTAGITYYLQTGDMRSESEIRNRFIDNHVEEIKERSKYCKQSRSINKVKKKGNKNVKIMYNISVVTK